MEGRYDNLDEVKPHLQRAEQLKLKIKTTFVHPPIPTRDQDWQAVVDGTEDADFDYEAGHYVPTCMVGTGGTEEDAVADLLEQLGVTV